MQCWPAIQTKPMMALYGSLPCGDTEHTKWGSLRKGRALQYPACASRKQAQRRQPGSDGGGTRLRCTADAIAGAMITRPLAAHSRLDLLSEFEAKVSPNVQDQGGRRPEVSK
jgi:hypothetical protein